jgi:hypothetical protein
MWQKVLGQIIFEVCLMIRSLDDFSRIAREKCPKKLAVFAPEDEDLMLAVKMR